MGNNMHNMQFIANATSVFCPTPYLGRLMPPFNDVVITSCYLILSQTLSYSGYNGGLPDFKKLQGG